MMTYLICAGSSPSLRKPPVMNRSASSLLSSASTRMIPSLVRIAHAETHFVPTKYKFSNTFIGSTALLAIRAARGFGSPGDVLRGGGSIGVQSSRKCRRSEPAIFVAASTCALVAAASPCWARPGGPAARRAAAMARIRITALFVMRIRHFSTTYRSPKLLPADGIETLHLGGVGSLRRTDIVLELELQPFDARSIMHKGAEANEIGRVVGQWCIPARRREVTTHGPAGLLHFL